MLIECEKCHTTYVLDDKLIPPQGAPVQCTRCGHVFTARAPTASAPTEPTAAKSTQMFGAPGAQGRAPTFGAPGAEPPASGGPAGAPANRTMMFGAPNEPGAGGANRTVMFGAGGLEPPAVPASNKTVMFGAPGQEPPGAGAANKTVTFGAPGAAAPAPGSTASAAHRTMMFGAPGAEAAPGPQPTNRTMMFGAPGAGAAGAGEGPAQPMPAANKTMVFAGGGADPPAAPSNPRSTMMFGAVPPQGLAAAAPQPAPAPTAGKASSQTMMFGAPGAQPPPAAPPGKASSQTMMFGTPVVAPAPAQAPAPASAPAKSSSTMIFGATPVVGPGPGKSPKLTESTVRIGPDDLERMMREHEGLRGDEGALTPPQSPAAPPVPERHNKTQLFAMQDSPDGATPPAGNDAVARGQKTQLFAMSDPQPEPPAKGARPRVTLPSREGSLPPPPGVDPSILDTFPPDGQQPRRRSANEPDGVHTLLEPGEPRAGGAPAKARPPSVTLQNALHDPNATVMGDGLGDATVIADAPPPGGVELPPESSDLMQAATPQAGGQAHPSVDFDPAEALKAQVARRNRIALVVISLVLVAAALGVTWKVFGKMLLHRAPPAAAIEGCERALAQLRFDDSKSKETAVTQLNELVKQYPDFVEGHAALVTAVSLQLDDMQQRVRRIEQLVDRKNTLIKRYGTEKSPANWEALAQALSVQVGDLINEHRPLAERGHELDTQARAAYKGLETAVQRIGDPPKQAKLAALRAQALFHGVSGTDQALVLTKRYETTADGAVSDGWIELAIPEYAANARVSEELMTQAQAKLDELHQRDSTFLRTYVLSARLHLIRKELDAAAADLDQVVSMRKDHDVAQELREWLRKLPKADDKKDAPPP